MARSFSGLWKRCDFFLGQPEPECQNHNEFLAESGSDDDDFLRAEAAFVVIVIGMIFMAVAFSLYSLVHPRYMFKRLAGYLHIITSGIKRSNSLDSILLDKVEDMFPLNLRENKHSA